MQQIIDDIKQLYHKWSGKDTITIDVLPQSGSDRCYFRIHGKNQSVIATHGLNIKENETFIYFSKHFKNKNLSVPEIYITNPEKNIYLQEDFGNIALIDRLESEGLTNEVYTLFQKSLQQLAALQIQGDENLNYRHCLTSQEFGKQAIMADLLYFKYYFLDALRKPYDKQKLIDDFEALSTYLAYTEYKFFMFRDFQSRNIMVASDNSVHFIDYQGGMKGAPQYDVASILWQARANLPEQWKENLLSDYIHAFENNLGESVDHTTFRTQYNGYVLIRLLQVLGAYGFRGLFERKAHFLTSIPLALKNLKDFVASHRLGISVPEFKKVLEIAISDETIERFTPVKATNETPLIVQINSFSYKKGIPEDVSGNGGGFVFDCRGILNPGRFAEYKSFHGKDKSVKDFLEQQTKMTDFLNSVFDLVDITVEDYIRRGFSNLMVSFGCTGGQHRSVYAAEALARHLKNKFGVKIKINHIEQEAKNWINQ